MVEGGEEGLVFPGVGGGEAGDDVSLQDVPDEPHPVPRLHQNNRYFLLQLLCLCFIFLNNIYVSGNQGLSDNWYTYISLVR